jgi:hypothetical protein
MWVLLSQGLRRWVVASVALPLGIGTTGAIAGRLERSGGPTASSRGLRGASASAGRRSRTSAERAAGRRRGVGGR